MTRLSKVVVACSGWLACACAAETAEVYRAGPSDGPYGTIVTVEGRSLGGELNRIEFENGVTLFHSSELIRQWDDRKIEFRMPAPAGGQFRIEGPELSLAAGRFDPAPWRPRLLSRVSDERKRFDWAPLAEDTVVEAVGVNELFELHFHRGEAVVVQALNVEVDTVKLIPISADSVSGFYFGTRAGIVFGHFTATPNGVDVVSEAAPSMVDALVAADIDDVGTYAWLSESANRRLSKWRLVDGRLTEVQAISDPAEASGGALRMSVRGEHAWRVWATNLVEFDSEYRISAAYLAPEAAEFAAAEELGRGDDWVSIFSTHGVSVRGEVAVDACGIRDGVLHGASESCVAAAANPAGVLESQERERSEPRTFYAAFDSGIAVFACNDHVLSLRSPGAAQAEPFIAPCGAMQRQHRRDPAGIPSFEYAVAVVELERTADTYVLSKY